MTRTCKFCLRLTSDVPNHERFCSLSVACRVRDCRASIGCACKGDDIGFPAHPARTFDAHERTSA